MVNLLESVINNGSGYPARARGFTLPAAGKTGTSHDGWFAGFTSNLLAVVWVGYDDDRQLGLAGGSSALLLWTDFMKAAAKLPAYQNVQPFPMPAGIVTAPIDNITHLVATGSSSSTRDEVFIEGTEPTVAGGSNPAPGIADANKDNQPSGITKILGEILHGGKSHAEPAPAKPPGGGTQTPPAGENPSDPQAKPKAKGVLGKFLSVFKGKSQTPPPPPPPANPPDKKTDPQ